MIILIFTLAYMLKGGWFKIPIPSVINKRVLPLFLVFGVCVATVSPMQAALFTTAWAWCFSSMGEEAGSVGDYKEGWGDYLDHFDRSCGIKKALQWGLAWGSLMALVTGYLWFIPAAASFPIVYFIGSSLYRLIHNDRSWKYAEPIYGAVIGLAYMGFINGYS